MKVELNIKEKELIKSEKEADEKCN